MILEVLTYPNKKLYERSKEVDKFDKDLHKFLDDMYDTMVNKKGIGLAAIQVGRPIRAIVINIPNEDGIQEADKKMEIINPVIVDKKGEIIYQEGCLSVPGFYEDVVRAEFADIAYQDRFGNKQKLEASELLAVCVQHEMDHLDGHLFIEKLNFNQRKKFTKEFKKKLSK